MSTKLPMVYTYVSEEEKKALEILAKMEKRSLSKALRFLVVNSLVEKGLLTEIVNGDGEIVQTILVGPYRAGEVR